MFQHPVPGPVTRGYGPRPHFGFHNGFDHGWLLADPVNSRRVISPADGVVTEVKWNALVGNYVTMRVSIGSIRMAHFASTAVRVGQTVKRGQTVIGVMGSTGLQSSGVHLHTDLIVKGERIDPAPHFTIPFGTRTPSTRETEDDMKLIRREGGTPEWSLFHPTLRGPSELERGYLVVTDVEVAKGLARVWADGFGTEKVEPRDVYVGQQAAARWAYDRNVSAGIDLTPVLEAVASVPTAAQNGVAAREAIVK